MEEHPLYVGLFAGKDIMLVIKNIWKFMWLQWIMWFFFCGALEIQNLSYPSTASIDFHCLLRFPGLIGNTLPVAMHHQIPVVSEIPAPQHNPFSASLTSHQPCISDMRHTNDASWYCRRIFSPVTDLCHPYSFSSTNGIRCLFRIFLNDHLS